MSTEPLPYTPSKDDVKTIWVEAGENSEAVAFKNHPPAKKELSAEFDRFIAKIKAEALREAANDLAVRLQSVLGGREKLFVEVDRLLERADQIEGSADEH